MSKQNKYDKLDILGVKVDAISISDAIDYVIQLAAPDHPAAYVVKPYVEFIDRAYKDEHVRELLNNADLAIPDGVALTWAAAYLYAGRRSFWRYWHTLFQIVISPEELRWPLPDRAAGINFSLPLLTAAASSRSKVFLIGNPKTALGIESTAAHLKSKFPKLNIVGTMSGRDSSTPPGRVSAGWYDQLVIALADTKPDLILVGIGFPLQEEVSAHLVSRVSHGVFVGEGGSFDFEAFGGSLAKAPPSVQSVGLEWLWRLGREPKRIFRQLAVPRFMYRVWKNR